MNRRKAFEDLVQSCSIVLPEHRKVTWEKKLNAIFRYGQINEKEVELLLNSILNDEQFVQTAYNLSRECFGDNDLPWEKLPLSKDEKETLSTLLWSNSVIRLLKLLVKKAEENHGRFL